MDKIKIINKWLEEEKINCKIDKEILLKLVDKVIDEFRNELLSN
jgi:hypothetical protein